LAISSLLRCIDFASVGITNAAMHNIVALLPAVPAMVLLTNGCSIISELISSWFLFIPTPYASYVALNNVVPAE
jgi:hypothetical protein